MVEDYLGNDSSLLPQIKFDKYFVLDCQKYDKLLQKYNPDRYFQIMETFSLNFQSFFFLSLLLRMSLLFVSFFQCLLTFLSLLNPVHLFTALLFVFEGVLFGHLASPTLVFIVDVVQVTFHCLYPFVFIVPLGPLLSFIYSRVSHIRN